MESTNTSKNQINNQSNPDLDEKEDGIQWQTFQELIEWNQLSEDGSFHELTPCRIKIDSGYLCEDQKLNAFVWYLIALKEGHPYFDYFQCLKNHRVKDRKAIFYYWFRITEVNLMEDVMGIINNYNGHHHQPLYEEIGSTGYESTDWIHVYGHWIARDEMQSFTKQQIENRSRFFKELQSISGEDTASNIMQVTITIDVRVLDKMFREWGDNGLQKMRLLTLFPNGTYRCESVDNQIHLYVEKRHCGVWDYIGNEIIMTGFGFEEKEDSGKKQSHQYGKLSSEMIIEFPALTLYQSCDMSVVVYYQ